MTAYLFDSAVVTFGNIVDNALMEMDEFGPQEHRQRRPRYTIAQVLDPEFTLPLPETDNGAMGMDDLRGVDGVNFDEV